jgi:hypothetical protein
MGETASNLRLVFDVIAETGDVLDPALHRRFDDVIRYTLPDSQIFKDQTVKFATLERVVWFNHPRLLEPIGNIPPAKAEARCYTPDKELVRGARLKPNRLRQTRRGSDTQKWIELASYQVSVNRTAMSQA